MADVERPSSPRPRASVVIPAFNAERTIDLQLDALAQQDFDEPWEIVVVDNGSTDGTRTLLETWQAKLAHLRVIDEPRRGVNRARNAGVAAARADRILLCDADDIVDVGWVRLLTNGLDEVDLVAGRLDYELLNTEDVRARTRARPLAEGLAARWRRPWGMTSNLGFHRRVFDAVDGFDPDFERGGSDDLGFCLRADAVGFSCGFAREAVVHYRMRVGPREHARQLYHYAKGDEQLYRKHRAMGALEGFPPRTRWNLNAARAIDLVRNLTTLRSSSDRERYIARTAKIAGGVVGLWRYQVRDIDAVTTTRSSAARALAWFTPHGLVARRRARSRARTEEYRRVRYEAIMTARSKLPAPIHDYDTLVGLAVEFGGDPELLRVGSIPAESLDFILDRIDVGPGLHIGNFAGLSLAYMAARVDGIHVAVDPNVQHWGVGSPQDTVVRLLQAAGVEHRVLLICGYSLDWNPSNDGSVVDGYDPSSEAWHEVAPIGVLPMLETFDLRFRWVVLDGNHEPDYLRAELDALRPLIVDGGLAFLDDCDPYWPDIRAVFENERDGWRADGNNHRVGVLRRTSVAGQD